MNSFKYLNVFLNGSHVGTLATTNDRVIAFEYTDNWINHGFSISPISLPLVKTIYKPNFHPFNGIYGVFNDSLPDSWGVLLVDKYLRKLKINPSLIDVLNRLALVQKSGMGALSYEPVHDFLPEEKISSYDHLAKECSKILEDKSSKSLDEIFGLGRSSGGAIPKILTKIDNEDYIVKFKSSMDNKLIGLIEYQYSLCAKECGIEMSDTMLIKSNICQGYFATKRFDRVNGKRVHVISISGLLETPHYLPNLDYNILMNVTLDLTGNYQEVEKLYRLMCFNVFAYNRDDHSKNFSFIYDEDKSIWHLSPAYDLTFCNLLEHTTTVNGEGKKPSLDHILAVGAKIGLKESFCKDTALFIKDKCQRLLKDLKLKPEA